MILVFRSAEYKKYWVILEPMEISKENLGGQVVYSRAGVSVRSH
jgi:hypothetical protein